MDKENKKQSNRIGTGLKTLSNASLSSINLLDEHNMQLAEAFIKKIMISKKSGIESVADGLAVMTRAHDLQLPFSSCIEHIHVINGKTGIDIHIIKSLLLRAGVVWECTKDYAPQYQYTDGNTIYLETQLPDYCVKCKSVEEADKITTNDKLGVYPVKWYQDLKGAIYNEFQISDKCVKAINFAQAKKIANEGKYPVIRIATQPIDFVTEYKFTRFDIINGKERVRNSISHFSLSEAKAADLVNKESYTKYARIMVSHRAFTLGARDIAPDALMGCYETTEIKLMNNIKLSSNDFQEIEPIEINDTDFVNV